MSWFSRLFGGGVARIDGTRARRLVSAGALLVDVRSPAEFAGGHIEGARNVPVGDLASLQGTVSPDTVLVVCCASGVRSARARGRLEALGFAAVHDLGGLGRW